MDLDAIRSAEEAGRGLVRHTPVLGSRYLSDRCGGRVVLKAESLQRTGAFKLRGALAKLSASRAGEPDGATGVVTGSAGNHAHSLARAARERGVPCTVLMPQDAAIVKVEAAAALGASIELVEGTVDDCIAAASERAAREGEVLVHPFDDPDVIAGQGTLGLELIEEIEDLACVVVPLGGGGLLSGVAVGVKSRLPGATVVGVQAGACAPWPGSLAEGRRIAAPSALTIADGIAVKGPGELTLPLVRRWVDDIVTVEEDAIAEAMVHLMERSRLVVEGAGAVGVAALMAGAVEPARTGTTAVVLSGGNVDAGLLATVARRHETEAGRRLVLMTRISDRPGGLAALLTCVAATGANIVDVEHVREGLPLHVRETAVQLVLETRGHRHAGGVLESCRDAGYDVEVIG